MCISHSSRFHVSTTNLIIYISEIQSRYLHLSFSYLLISFLPLYSHFRLSQSKQKKKTNNHNPNYLNVSFEALENPNYVMRRLSIIGSSSTTSSSIQQISLLVTRSLEVIIDLSKRYLPFVS